MANNSYYWENKQSRAVKATKHIEDMDKKYKKEIEDSIRRTEIYDGFKPTEGQSNCEIKLCDLDSVSAVLKSSGKTCVLNFASYKHPGGMFLKGSKAQEECLCHESTLYNVLKEFSEYYEYNKQNLNKALYLDRALYSSGIIFERNGVIKEADVLTCASPNFSAASKYCNVSKTENSRVLRQRIRFVLSILDQKELDTIILGAYGCGVFGQDPEEVATIFVEEIQNILNRDVKVVFAVIDKDSPNYRAFEKVLCY